MFLPDVESLLIDELQANVQKGAAWLDEYTPGWVQKIVPEKLDITNGVFCICGQVFGNYMYRPEALQEEPWKYGFTVDLADSPFKVYCSCTICLLDNDSSLVPNILNSMAWTILDTLWLDEIYWRCTE